MLVKLIRTLLLALILLGALGRTAATAQGTTVGKDFTEQAGDKEANSEDVLPADQGSETTHTLKINGKKLRYVAHAGVLPIKTRSEGPECRVFFISYELAETKESLRPLTFVFNGGPGASSAYLHLGALGPRRVVFAEDGGLPGPPAGLSDNRNTWLLFSDLVFVDPVGTGYSRCLCKAGEEGKDRSETQAWGVREDLVSLAKFIQLYLTRNERWLSPKFLAGESYGGFRAAALTGLLQSDYGISPNGLILVSPVLEFGLTFGNDYSPLRWIVPLPSYAATARYHQAEEAGPTFEGTAIRQGLKGFEHFIIDALMPAISRGSTADLNGRLSLHIGLPEKRIERLQARVPPTLFAKEFLKDEGRIISVYDGSWSTIDPDPASPLPPGLDLLLVKINTLLTPAFNSYVRGHLQFKTDLPYKVLNKDVSRKWNWRSGLESEQGFVGTAAELKKSMCVNTDLKVLIVHGVFDFVTPYFGSVVLTRQMALDPKLASNLILKVYEGGHMFYTHRKARLHFFEDARQFYRSSVFSHKDTE